MGISAYWVAAVCGVAGYHLARAIRFTSLSECIAMGLAAGAIYSTAMFTFGGMRFRIALLLAMLIAGSVGGWLGFLRRRTVDRRRRRR
jgi:Na+-translocating ferredoxin:NAD+ oxidoreductase RnfA subunit